MIDTYLNKVVAKIVMEENAKERENHIPSGKLSASILGFPLQWQILKNIGIEDPMDEYTLRKFQRGRDVEDRVVGWIPNIIETQIEVEYRGVVGFADAIVDMKDHDLKKGVIPHEIKSVVNAYFKWIKKDEQPSRSHKLQATLYALALGYEFSAIDYVASDDYRILTFVFPVTDCKEEIDQIITDYYQQMSKRVVPIFEPKEPWHTKPDYQKYYEFKDLTEKEIEELLKTKYPESYKRLKGEK